MENKPRVSFIFPYRWVKEDKEYLGKNLVKQIKKYLGADGVEKCRMVTVYYILLTMQANEPEKYQISKAKLQKALKPIFPNGKLLEIQKEYRYHQSRTMHPIIDFNLFY